MNENTILATPTTKFKNSMSNEEYQSRLHEIRNNVTHDAHKYPRSFNEYYDSNSYISSVLKSIRNGDVDYLYSERQVIDVLKYEPSSTFSYDPYNGTWAVWL